MKSQSTKTYITKDIYEAAFLYAYGYSLIDLEKDYKHYNFVFKDTTGDCLDIAKSYWSRTGTIVAKDYMDAFRTLKDLIFSRKHKNGF